MDKMLNIISSIPLFNGLPEDQIVAIKKIAVEKKINKGEIIFSEGDEGNGFFVVADGRVKVFKVSTEGKEQILHIFGPGQPFGEVPVFAGQKFPANAQAIDKTRVLFFPRASIVNLISANPSLALNMLAVMSKKLRQFAVQIENLSLKEMPARLASYLIFLAERTEQRRPCHLENFQGSTCQHTGYDTGNLIPCVCQAFRPKFNQRRREKNHLARSPRSGRSG